MTVDEVVGRNVHQLIWDRRLQAKEVYGRMRISRSSLNKKMRGEVTWSAADIAAAAAALGVAPGELFAGFQEGVENTAPRNVWAPRGSNPQPTVSRSDEDDCVLFRIERAAA